MLTRKQKWRMTIRNVNYNKLYQELEIQKMVAFDNVVKVILIEKANENEDIKEDYWWSEKEINQFKENYISYIRENKLNAK